MKDERSDMSIKGIVALKSKMCTFITEDNRESKKTKGINKNALYDELKQEDYKNVFLMDHMRHEINRIQSKDHNIGSYRINKLYFSSFKDKKYVL